VCRTHLHAHTLAACTHMLANTRMHPQMRPHERVPTRKKHSRSHTQAHTNRHTYNHTYRHSRTHLARIARLSSDRVGGLIAAYHRASHLYQRVGRCAGNGADVPPSERYELPTNTSGRCLISDWHGLFVHSHLHTTPTDLAQKIRVHFVGWHLIELRFLKFSICRTAYWHSNWPRALHTRVPRVCSIHSGQHKQQ
jgi:hypothetical protein